MITDVRMPVMDGILGCNGQDEIVIFNTGMEQLSGVDRQEVIRKKAFSDFFLADEAVRLKKAVADDRYGGKDRLFQFETELLGSGGGRIPVQLSVSVIFNQGVPDGRVCFIRDIRKLRQMEREMEDQGPGASPG